MVAWAAGCQQKTSPAAQVTGPPVIPVAHPAQRKVVDFVDFTGTSMAKEMVSLRPRVSGYLIKPQVQFVEGSDVVDGDLLFEIDPSQYKPLYDQAVAQLAGAKAQENITRITYQRDKSLGGTVAVSEQQIQQDMASWDAAKARVQQAEAAVKSAKNNLDWTHVVAPISGRIGRIYYTPGNSVTADSTILTTIVSMDPMYAYFDIDERTFHRYNKSVKEENTTSSAVPAEDVGIVAGGLGMLGLPPLNPVYMALEGDVGFPWVGNINFLNNQVNPSTGTVTARGVFRNVRRAGGNWRMVPGMFLRIRLPLGQPHEALLVIDRAIGSDQGQKFVYVVGAENKVQYRKVVTGALQEDGLRVIEPWDENEKTGLKPDDLIVVGGLPQLRPSTEIKMDVQAQMPSLATNDIPAVSRSRPQPPTPGKKR